MNFAEYQSWLTRAESVVTFASRVNTKSSEVEPSSLPVILDLYKDLRTEIIDTIHSQGDEDDVMDNAYERYNLATDLARRATFDLERLNESGIDFWALESLNQIEDEAQAKLDQLDVDALRDGSNWAALISSLPVDDNLDLSGDTQMFVAVYYELRRREQALFKSDGSDQG